MTISRMVNQIQGYDWGSRAMLAALRAGLDPLSPDGISETARPEAEQWMGSHPKAPSSIVDGEGPPQSLREAIRARPDALLGPEARRLQPPGEPEPALPFLLKILTAEHALSIQSHPDRRLAAEGFDREESEGVPIDAPERNYRDRNHKPELICALSDFWGLRGFRPFGEIAGELAEFRPRLKRTPALQPIVASVDRFLGAPGAETWREAFPALVDRGGGADELTTALHSLLADHGFAAEFERPARNSRYWWCAELLRRYPGDAGALAPLYLNLVHLAPGEALHLEAGVLHAYLYGAGVEIMAESDNVLRAGCTRKHVDTGELVRSLSWNDEAPQAIRAPRGARVERYATPADEFELTRVHSAAGAFELRKKHGPGIILSIAGAVRVGESVAAGELELRPTQSAFVPHRCRRFTLELAPGAAAYIAALPGAIHAVV